MAALLPSQYGSQVPSGLFNIHVKACRESVLSKIFTPTLSPCTLLCGKDPPSPGKPQNIWGTVLGATKKDGMKARKAGLIVNFETSLQLSTEISVKIYSP